MNKKLTIISIFAVFMLVAISYASAINTKSIGTDVEKASPLYKVRAERACTPLEEYKELKPSSESNAQSSDSSSDSSSSESSDEKPEPSPSESNAQSSDSSSDSSSSESSDEKPESSLNAIKSSFLGENRIFFIQEPNTNGDLAIKGLVAQNSLTNMWSSLFCCYITWGICSTVYILTCAPRGCGDQQSC